MDSRHPIAYRPNIPAPMKANPNRDQRCFDFVTISPDNSNVIKPAIHNIEADKVKYQRTRGIVAPAPDNRKVSG